MPVLLASGSAVERRPVAYDALLRNTLVEYKQNANSQKKFEYVYNLADYRLLEKRHHAAGTGDNYDIDSIYRSVNVKAGVADPVAEYQNPGSQTVASTTGVTYDAAQNRSQVTVTVGGTPTTTNYTVDALNFYTAVGATVHVRDANGNLKDDGTNLYDYDYRNQLVRIRRKSDLAVIGTYEYDGVCRRTAKSTSAGTTSFYWIGFELAMEYDTSGLVSRRHRGAGFNEVVSAQQRDIADLDQDGSTTDYVPLTPLYDGAFDCIGVLDQTGAVAESYVHTYDGVVTIANAAGGSLANSAVGWHQGYGRMYGDAETGLLYAVHRYYGPATGRFITEDPAGRWFDSPNLGGSFAWGGNRYRNSVDVLGLRAEGPALPGGFGDGLGEISAAAHNASATGALSASDQADMDALAAAAEHVTLEVYSGALVPVDAGYTAYSRGDLRDANGNWIIRINYDRWQSMSYGLQILTLVHELMHVARYLCGDVGEHHVKVIERTEQLKRWEARAKQLLVLMKNLQGEGRPIVAPGIDALDGEDGADADARIASLGFPGR
ncbi:MAG TPA: hypothetical protein VFY93_16740 [Planctomycetota bacterium]|nr:hypothetical protein [Planctomycetota bacterium]